MSWIKTIADGIDAALSACRPALTAIPPILLLCSIMKRPGLSAIALTAAIIRRLPEVGIETGVNPDGSPNKILGMVRVMSEEIVKEIKDNMRIDGAIGPAAIASVGVASTPAGPLVVNSTNVGYTSFYGISR